MLTRTRKIWDVIDHRATDEALVTNRRKLLAGMGMGTIGLSFIGRAHAQEAGSLIAPELYPGERNPAFTLDRPLTEEKLATTYNNFYEFGGSKDIVDAAQALTIKPWTLTIDGMVEQTVEMDVGDIVRRLPIEERLYRHRCVEAWSMDVPWSGFPLKVLLDLARPQGSAKYVRFETFLNPDEAPAQQQSWYPWPYIEGLSIAEAGNDLAFIATGMYGKPLLKQNGAPIRLVTPWKYGFKSIKSIRKITLTDQRPVSYWEELGPSEYGFWANVNPEVPHPRWSQAYERPLGDFGSVPTRLFNGYAEQVASLYSGMEGEQLFM
ncbi:MAG TPA: protein-methionine-sulfoxide reductase catalytic subunit MsrP [Geminicoccus sp.]|jgi:sulfoxide reductase catalytic subunit YedY|uniref:protein-methionine-sulfoxide reductase catalytic subunit MsrP n=1 Tax=Geminicoccus sp. TaxID=2024832 RepID=UPI002E2EECE2|nr:protein-methionine-sulfoxide reductase catalytic subunit MsrP [Geminicoccus sp.]HEX2526575.1 protein-methionine-sulfoxide reductase catalytic subunit MsrP [Geminicoccus sp.]